MYVDNDGVIIAPETAGAPLVEYSREIFENPKAVVHGRVDVVLPRRSARPREVLDRLAPQHGFEPSFTLRRCRR